MSPRDVSASRARKHEHALEHPIRVRILNRLGEQRLVSPVDLSSDLRLPLRQVAYHFHRLHVLGLVELARVTATAGGQERQYRLAPDAAAAALVRRVRHGVPRAEIANRRETAF